MLFGNHLILLRGGGDLATGVAYRLHHAGFPVIVTELPNPLVVRRRVALATAVREGEIQSRAIHSGLAAGDNSFNGKDFARRSQPRERDGCDSIGN